jgi:hypothetical protein
LVAANARRDVTQGNRQRSFHETITRPTGAQPPFADPRRFTSAAEGALPNAGGHSNAWNCGKSVLAPLPPPTTHLTLSMFRRYKRSEGAKPGALS